MSKMEAFAEAMSAEIEKRESLLRRAVPMLVKLGDFIGNGPITGPDSMGERCDLIGEIRAILREENNNGPLADIKPYVPDWCYEGGAKLCECGDHEGFHSDSGECLRTVVCGCAGFSVA